MGVKRQPPIDDRHASLGLAIVASVLLPGCGLGGLVATSAGAGLARDMTFAIERHDDPELIRAGMPAFLLLLDALLVSNPEDPELLRSASRIYTLYGQAFVSSEDDSERAAKLLARASRYGLRALSGTRPELASALNARQEDFEAALQKLDAASTEDVHVAATAWLAWIISDAESMETFSELPKALALARRALELDETANGGAIHLVFGIYYAVQPNGAGQDIARSRSHFERALEIAGPGSLMPLVLYAEIVGKATLDREFFRSRLDQVVNADLGKYPEQRLANELARARAEQLLFEIDDLFFEDEEDGTLGSIPEISE